MSDKKGLRFILDDDNKARNFVYRPPNANEPPVAQNATLGVKFAQRRVILDDWWLIGGTRWSRMLFRLRHPFVYSKRGLRNLYRRIKRLFVKPKMYPCPWPIKWVSKEEAKKIWPDENELDRQRREMIDLCRKGKTK